MPTPIDGENNTMNKISHWIIAIGCALCALPVLAKDAGLAGVKIDNLPQYAQWSSHPSLSAMARRVAARRMAGDKIAGGPGDLTRNDARGFAALR